MFNTLRRNSLLVPLVSLLLGTPLIGFSQSDMKEASIAAKLTPDLLNLQQNGILKQKGANLRQAASSPDNADPSSLVDDLLQVRDGMVAIDAIANDADAQALLSQLESMGMADAQYFKKIVSGYFPISKLSQLRNVAALHVARPALRPFTNVGKVTSQGDVAMRSDIARQTYNVTGKGLKVGVLSDSYDALKGAADGVASGDLPTNVQVLKDYTAANATDEGRAMVEIIHDVAPGADIAFHTAFTGYADFANGIIRLAQAGCRIITDDIYYYAEPFFQDGIVSQAIDYVNKNWSVSYFKSAGNAGRQSYSSGFRNSGKLPYNLDYPIGSGAHDFGQGRVTQKVVVPAGGTFRCVLQWSDPFYSESIYSGSESGARTDIDLLVYYRGQLLTVGGYANIGNDPYEYVSITNPYSTPIELELAIVKYEGPDPDYVKWVNFASTATSIEFDTKSSTVVGHANAKGAISVGAAIYAQTPAYNAVRYPNALNEYFSSAGGTPILFTTYGAPIPAEIRLKPDIVAPDGANTTFFIANYDLDRDGFPNFTGTSAAAPHAAGVAALLQERNNYRLSPDDVQLYLRQTALDMDDPLTTGFDQGFDYQTGFGFIQADKALMYGQNQPLVILKPTYDCATQQLSVTTAGGDGTPITFTMPGVKRTPPTSATATATFFVGRTINYTTYIPASTTGIVEDGVVKDSRFIEITAYQSGRAAAVYAFKLDDYCPSNITARAGAAEPGVDLQVAVMGNPVSSDWVDLEVRGAQGQPLKLQVSNALGGVTSSKSVEMIESVERHKVLLGRTPGLYFLQVTTPTETKTIKVVRQ